MRQERLGRVQKYNKVSFSELPKHLSLAIFSRNNPLNHDWISEALEENGKVNLFVRVVNIKSIAFRSNRFRRLFTFIPSLSLCYSATYAKVGYDIAKQASYQWLSTVPATSYSLRNIIINLALKRNLFSFLYTRDLLSLGAQPSHLEWRVS